VRVPYALFAVGCWVAMVLSLADGHAASGIIEGLGGLAWFAKLMRYQPRSRP